MSNYLVNDDLLYKHMRTFENTMLDALPKENELYHDFSKSYKRKIRLLLKIQRRSCFTNQLIKLSKNVAVIFIVVISIAFTSVMSVEAYRVRFFDKVTEIWNEFTSIVFQSEENNSELLVPVELGYIPIGFKITEEKVYPYEYYLYLENETGIEIMFEQAPINTNAFIVDTENTLTENIVVANQEVTYFINKNVHQFYWNDDKYVYTLISEYDKNELTKIIENILEKSK
ncbi:DUF4367 domain-containing protein [Anaerotignum sp.]|uniref:DUF4367 domain-containing protein n=1 Tax=Anaerotignum sp. TaxID=2039241 RepID=UPI0028B09919|nr:DUF4367 domain-containing protein [Anaerotignum sp.]